MLMFGKTDFNTPLKTIFLIGKYDTGIQSSAPPSVESKVDGRCVLTLYHDWGPKGAVLFRIYLDSLVRSELGKQPTISVTDDVITVNFPSLSKPHP